MKRVVVSSISVAVIMFATMFFGGCDKDNTPSLVSGGFDGKITAKVEDGATYNAYFTKVWAFIGTAIDNDNVLHYDELIAQGVYSNGGFTIDLPSSVKDEHLVKISDFFEDELNISGDLKYSNLEAKIIDVDFFALNNNDQWYGYFASSDDEASNNRTWCFFVYVDADVTVTGGPTVSFKKGWNRLYYSSGKKLVTTKEPSGMKWHFNEV